MKHRFYISILTFVLSLLSLGAKAQIDTEFWFAAPSIVEEHDPEVIFLQVVAYDDDATISITQPAAGRTLIASRVVPRHSTYSFPIKSVSNYRTTVETPADGEVHPNGLLVRSTAKVTAYYATTDPNSEVYTLKGRHGMGYEFVVPSQYRHNCGHNAYSSIEIVATDDGTTVQIQTLVPTNMSPTPTIITVTLNRGETYAIRSLSPNTTGAQHLGGTVIASDKPICVNTTDDSAAAGADLDLIGEQLVPTTLAGSRYIVPVNNSANHEYAYLYAIVDPADIYTVDATGTEQLVASIAPGTPAEVALTRLDAEMLYTKDNTPFVCFHLTGNENGNELSGTILPALNCSGSEEVCYVPALSDKEVKVTILTRTEDIGSFLVNGSRYDLPASFFFPVPGDSVWSYCSCANLILASGQYSFDIRNTTGLFHLGILDNGGGACSYGFFSSFSDASLYAAAQQNYYMSGDTLRFHLSGASAFSHILWQGPQGTFGENEGDPYLVGGTELSGMYTVSAEHEEGCEVAPDTFYVNVFPALTHLSDTICQGDSLRLKAELDKPLTWYQDGTLLPDLTSRYYIYHADASALFTIEGQRAGVDMIEWADSLPLVLPSADSLILSDYHFDCLIPGAEYVWTVTLEAPNANTVAPKVRLYVDDEQVAFSAVPNGTRLRVSARWTATGKNARVQLVIVSPRPERSLAIRDMELRPYITFTESREVVAIDCDEPDPECPELIYEDAVVTLCDTILPYTWHGRQLTETGTYYDTLRTMLSNGVECDSICYSLELSVEHCGCDYELIDQRWDDVLFCLNEQYNGGYTPMAYRWYCNGVLMVDATASYIYVSQGLTPGDVYELEITTTDGDVLLSCPYIVPAATPVSVAPAAEKVLRDGRILILRDDHTYTPEGLLVE